MSAPAFDDEVLIRMVIAEHLRDCGFRVIEAGDGDEAIEVLQADNRIHIVFSDVQMPNRNGFELARWLRRERPGGEDHPDLERRQGRRGRA